MTPPEIQRLSSEDLILEIIPALGGRIHRLQTAGGLDILRTPQDPSQHEGHPFHYGSYPLVPWANRIAGGRLQWMGRTVDLPVNFADGSAIHGEAYLRPWTVRGPGQFSFRGGEHGFPWSYLATQSFFLDGPVLTYTLAVTNTGDETMPAGLGIHPWWTATRITVDAAVWSPTMRAAAQGESEPVTDIGDLRLGSDVPWGVDAVWGDLGRRCIDLGWPEAGVSARLGFSSSARFVTVAAFEELGAMAVEPQTQQVGRPEALAPGEVLSVTYVVTVAGANR